MKLAILKRRPTATELRESREFYEAIGPLSRRKAKTATQPAQHHKGEQG